MSSSVGPGSIARSSLLPAEGDVPLLWVRLLWSALALTADSRAQGPGQAASCTYLHWWALHKNEVLDAVTVRCTLLTPEREPRKMGKGVLGAPFSLIPFQSLKICYW